MFGARYDQSRRMQLNGEDGRFELEEWDIVEESDDDENCMPGPGAYEPECSF